MSLSLSFNTKALQKLRNASWIMIFFSIIIDISHVRAFPSYNVVIGFWACYCGHFQSSILIHNNNGTIQMKRTNYRSQRNLNKKGEEELKYLQKMISSFSVIASMSVIFDILFCSMWGKEVRLCYFPCA